MSSDWHRQTMDQSATDIQFNEVEQKIIYITRDGKCHTYEEVCQCLNDPAADKVQVRNVLIRLRSKLVALDQDIIAQSFGRRIEYRRIRSLCPMLAGT